MMRHTRALSGLDQEMRDHIELEMQENIARGMTPGEARDAAIRAFGRPLRAAEEARGVWVPVWLDQLRQDLAGGIRSMRRHPVAALVAVLSIAGGTGAATVTLLVRDAIFRNPPPLYRDPGQISRVQVVRPDDPLRRAGNRVPTRLYLAWQPSLGARLAGSLPEVVREARTADRTAAVPVRAVTASLFTALGVEPIAGRGFAAAAEPGGPARAILSYGAWQQLFDGRPESIGRTFWLDDKPFVASGVMPERFWYADTDYPIWTLVDPARLPPDDSLDVLIRRPDGMTPAALDALLAPGLAAYASQLPSGGRQIALALSGIEGTPLGRQVSVALPYFLGMAVLLTLLIACANIAVLTIAQWAAREHEIAIRAALGASRGRIVRSLLTESMVVAACGGALAVGATLALREVVLHRGGTMGFLDLSIRPEVFVSVALLVLMTGFLIGLAPALRETRGVQQQPLRRIVSPERCRWRGALVVVEIALTVALLVQALALVDGYRRWMRGSLGYDAGKVVAARVENPAGVAVARLLDNVETLPGVEEAAASTTVPFGARGPVAHVSAVAGGETIAVERAEVSPSFFAALGVRLLAGRGFADGYLQAPRSAIVNQALAARLFPGGRAVGRTIRVGGVPYDLVGVAADYSNQPLQPVSATLRLFTPLPPGSARRIGFVVRSREGAPLVQPLRRTLRDAATGNVVGASYRVRDVLEAGGAEILVGTAPLAPLIGIGLLLTAAGIHGVLAFAVARRSRELAVRAAVGATSADLVRLVLGQTLRLVGTGAGAGIALTFAMSRLIRAAGGAGTVFDPPPAAFAVPALVIGFLAVSAAWLPARRASSIDPVVLLRTT